MRHRVGLLVVATMTLVLVAFLVPLALLVRTVARDRAIAGATADIQGIIAALSTADPDTLRLGAEQVALTSGRPVTVYLANGTVLGTQTAPTPAVQLAARGRSVTVEHADGYEITLAVLGRPEGNAVIRTFVPAAELTRGVDQAWLALAGLGAVLILLGLIVADLRARSLVAPIAELSAVSARLARAELTARVRPSGPPEVREVGVVLNHLADRIQELLREERERVADLSHRLRTPLTALRLEAESLQPSDAARIVANVDAIERTVTGLIRQARRRGDPAPARAHCDAAEVVRERVAFWGVLAEDTGREVTLTVAPGPLPVRLPADELAAALDALLANVFAHTPAGTPFSVTLAAQPGPVARLTVTDRGPGLPPDQLRRGASRAGSTGLGLDIAARAAMASGGRLELSAAAAGGAQVTLYLGGLTEP